MKAVLVLSVIIASLNINAQAPVCLIDEQSEILPDEGPGFLSKIELFNAITGLLTHNLGFLNHDRFRGIKIYAQAFMTLLTMGRLYAAYIGEREYFSYFCYASSALSFSSGMASGYYMWQGIGPRLPLPVWHFPPEQRVEVLMALWARIKEGPGDFKETVCVICAEDYLPVEAISHLDCGHDFHTACLHEWVKTLPLQLCAVCRK